MCIRDRTDTELEEAKEAYVNSFVFSFTRDVYKRQEKDRTVLVGDSTNDINGGHNAGIRVCAVGYGMGNRQKMAACEPDWFIERPEELMELFI